MIKNSLEKIGYDYEEIGEEIFLIKNFFTEKELLPIWNIVNSATEKDWEKDYRDSQIALAEKKFGRTDLENLINEGLIEYTYAWSDKAIAIDKKYVEDVNKRLRKIFSFDKSIKFHGIDTVQRQYKDSPLIEHVDSDSDPSIAYACIGYLNDDYSDGELFFGNIGLRIKPPARSLIIFPSGEKYLHGVESPGPGPHRYAMPTFAVYSGFFDKIE